MHPHIQKNLDTFKQTFQKPSRIYRFLYESWKTKPLYLNRTLSYVNKHRDHRIRKRNEGVDMIAIRLLKINKKSPIWNHNPPHIRDQYNQRNDPSGDSCDNEPESKGSVRLGTPSNPTNITRCYFNWICDDPTRTSQKTKSLGFTCPWCTTDFRYLDTLMMHLKCCHSRFNFNLVEEDGYSVIEMTSNRNFDGSYCGFKYPGHDLRRDFRFTPRLPERRTSTTQVIHFKSRRRTNLTSFENNPSNDNGFYGFNDDDEADVDVCSGRLYYHTSTCLPVKPNEGDIDSEADMDPDWLRERTQLMIDEFTDVNEGEKGVLKLWNLHIMRNYKYKGDFMIRQACLDFVESEGPTILSKNLTGNFTLHLANLYDFGLIGSGDLLECTRILKMFKPPFNSPTKTTSRSRLERTSNEHCHSPPAKRALLNSQIKTNNK